MKIIYVTWLERVMYIFVFLSVVCRIWLVLYKISM